MPSDNTGLRLPGPVLDEIDTFCSTLDLNRSVILRELLRTGREELRKQLNRCGRKSAALDDLAHNILARDQRELRG